MSNNKKRSVIRSNNNKEAVTSVVFIITGATASGIILPLIKVDGTLDAFHGDIFNGFNGWRWIAFG